MFVREGLETKVPSGGLMQEKASAKAVAEALKPSLR